MGKLQEVRSLVRSKELSELGNQFVLDEVPQGAQQTLHNVPRTWLPVHRYERAETQIWVWLQTRTTGVAVEDFRNYLVVFDRKSSESRSVVKGRLPVWRKAARAGDMDRTSDNYEVPVLIEVAESPDLSKVLARIHSVVRLYALNDAEGGWGHTASYPKGDVLRAPWRKTQALEGTLIADGELGRIGGRIEPIGADKLPCEMVKSASQVVYAVTDDRTPLRIIWRRMGGSPDMAMSVIPHFAGPFVGATVDELTECSVQSLFVELRSSYLDFHAVERGWLPNPLALHSLPLEGDAQDQRQRADTGDPAREGTTCGDTDSDQGTGVP